MKTGKVAVSKESKQLKKGLDEWKERSRDRRHITPGHEGYWYSRSKCNRL